MKDFHPRRMGKGKSDGLLVPVDLYRLIKKINHRGGPEDPPPGSKCSPPDHPFCLRGYALHKGVPMLAYHPLLQDARL